jgi:hypothetical protein
VILAEHQHTRSELEDIDVQELVDAVDVVGAVDVVDVAEIVDAVEVVQVDVDTGNRRRQGYTHYKYRHSVTPCIDKMIPTRRTNLGIVVSIEK